MSLLEAEALTRPVALPPPHTERLRRAWSAIWPKLGAIGIAIGIWQLVVWSGWRPEYVLPSPWTVFSRFGEMLLDGRLLAATATTMRRALTGYSLALVIGMVVGLGVARFRILRTAVGSLITGLQTMPSIAWFPLAILLFKLSEGAILFVVVLGAAPSIANGLLSGIDHVPPLLVRAGRKMGARGWSLYRHVIVPAALPEFVGGLKQGWAFAWRSLLAGELLVIIAARSSLGVQLHFARELSDASGLIAAMLAILAIGIVVDALIFNNVERRLRSRRGLLGAS